jgi:hypothetical protein
MGSNLNVSDFFSRNLRPNDEASRMFDKDFGARLCEPQRARLSGVLRVTDPRSCGYSFAALCPSVLSVVSIVSLSASAVFMPDAPADGKLERPAA